MRQMIPRLLLTTVVAALLATPLMGANTSGKSLGTRKHPHTYAQFRRYSAPDDVVRWYREHGYAFVVITDHTT